MRQILSLTLILLIPAPLFAQGPDPSKPYIQSVTYGGSGCPQGTVGSSFANDRLSFTLIFDQFVATNGHGVPSTEGRKNCQLNIDVHVPQGSSPVCLTADYRGYMQMPAGMSAEQSALYNFDGAQKTAGTPTAGPVSRDYLTRDETRVTYASERVTTSTTNINAQVRLTGPHGSSAQITTDSIDGKLQPCNNSYELPDGQVIEVGAPPVPAIATTRSIEPNANGWNNTDVTFAYACSSDNGIDTDNSVLADETLSDTGRAHGACVDVAGSVALSYHFAEIDKVAPTVTATGLIAGGLYGLNSVVPVKTTCADDNSGVASCTAPAAFNTSSIGAKAFTVTAVDLAGNEGTLSLPYAVGGKDECKAGHSLFIAPQFKNQGQCVATYSGKK